MKCINKKRRFVTLVTVAALLFSGCIKKEPSYVTTYETENYNRSLYQGELFANQLCVANTDTSLVEYQANAALHASALFGVNQKQVFHSDKIHERLYPASTTKLLTLYTALKHGNLDDVVTVGQSAEEVPWDSSMAYINVNEKLTLEDLLYGLMLASGNDSAAAIAEHISGNVDDFVALMNEEAQKLGATNTHFVNPHGYHDENHYTTAYDLYLILNAGMKIPKFVDIISTDFYSTTITKADGSTREKTWKQSNLYVNGSRTAPENVKVIGGKTGTTDEAGACLVLLNEDSAGNPYISIVMGAPSKADLYDNMTSLISTIPTIE